MERFLKPVFSEIITDKNKNNPNQSTFKIEKLERGYGNTLGTSLRRTILSSIPSIAPFAFELKGASHEFQGIKDVKEDVVEFVLNLKQIVFKTNFENIEFDSVLEAKLTSKEGKVTAGELELPAGIEVVNKDLVIANTSKDGAIKLKLFLIFSKGYKTFEENREIVKEKLGGIKSIISMDSDFSSIQKVNFKVEEVNPGEAKVYERLVMDITTKGGISPSESLSIAGSILKNHYIAFESLETIDETKTDDLFIEEEEPEVINSQLMIPISELHLSVRSLNGLEKAGIKTVGELIDRPFSGLKQIENLGDKSVSEIVEAIQAFGLSFKTE